MFRVLASIFFVLVVSPAARADNLLQILELAYEADPLFLGAGFEKLAALERLEQAEARVLPSASFSYEKMNTTQKINHADNTVYGTGRSGYQTNTSTFTISQSIVNYEFWMRYKQSEVLVSRAGLEFEKASQDLLLRVVEGYFEQLKTREQLAAIGAEKQALEAHLKYAQKSHNAGIARSAEVDEADARYLAAVAKEIEYQRNYNDARYNLMQVTGQLSGALVGVREDTPLKKPDPLSADGWIKQGLEHNPDVKIVEKILEEARFEIKAQRARRYPTVSLNFNKYSQDTGGSLFGGGSDVDTSEVVMKLDLPLYQGGAVSSSLREAIQRMYKAQEDLTLAKRSVQNQAQSSFQGMVSNIAQIKALGQAVVAQQSVLKSKEKGYQSGLYNLISLLDAQQDLANAQQAYIAVRNDYAINYVRLKRAAGVLTPGDLIEVNSWLDGAL